MKNMSIGDIKPREEDEDDGQYISIQVNLSTSTSNAQDQQIEENIDASQPQDEPVSNSTPPTQEPVIQPRIHHAIAKDHPVDQIVGDISKGVQTRSRIASFCEHYSFVSSIEPNRVDKAL